MSIFCFFCLLGSSICFKGGYPGTRLEQRANYEKINETWVLKRVSNLARNRKGKKLAKCAKLEHRKSRGVVKPPRAGAGQEEPKRRNRGRIARRWWEG